MILIKMTPLFVGTFLLMVGLAVQSEKKGEGEAPSILVPPKGFALLPEEEPVPILELPKRVEGVLEGELWTRPVPGMWPEPERCGASIYLGKKPVSTKKIPEPSLKPERIWVYTGSGEYLFYDLDTALAFSQPHELVVSEYGTVYRGGTETVDWEECSDEVESDRPGGRTNVQDSLSW